MMVAELIDYLQQFDRDVLVFLSEDQAAEARSDRPSTHECDFQYISLGTLDYSDRSQA